MESLFKEMLALYGDFAEKARQHREKVSLLQQNVDEYTHEKIERSIKQANSDFDDYVTTQQAKAEAIAARIMEIAEQRDTTFDVSELNGIFSYLAAAQSRADFKVLEKQIEKYRGIPTAISSVYAVAENNDAPAEVKGTVKSMFCNLDEISQKLAKNIYNVFNMQADAGECGRVLVLQAQKLGCAITNTIEDADGAAYIFRKFAGLI